MNVVCARCSLAAEWTCLPAGYVARAAYCGAHFIEVMFELPLFAVVHIRREWRPRGVQP